MPSLTTSYYPKVVAAEALVTERIEALPESQLTYRRADGHTVIYTQSCDCRVYRTVLDQYGQILGVSYIL